MKFLSVCSGIEAASCAWNPLGWKAVAFSEIEPFPCAVLAHHYPDTPNWGDMTQFKEWPDVSIDLLCGGTPCQSFSVAGLRKGLDDPRGNLMLTYGAIAAKYRPKWLVWENVPGVLSSNGGRDFGSFLGLLGQLGYGFAYRVLDAQYFGLAQRRRRVFVVGCLGDWRSAAAVLFERHSLQGHPAPSRQAGQRPTGTIASRTTGGGGLGTDFECSGGLQPVAGTMKSCKDSGGWSNSADHAAAGYMIPMPHAAISPAIKARDSKGVSSDGDGDGDGAILVPMVVGSLGCNTGPNGHGFGDFLNNQAVDAGHLITHSLRGEGFDASEDGTGRGAPLVPVAATLEATAGRSRGAGTPVGMLLPFDTTQMTSQANRSNPQPGDPCHPLAAGAHAPAIAMGINWQKSSMSTTLDKSTMPGVAIGWSEELNALEDIQPTIQRGGAGGRHEGVMSPSMQVRRLTPKECARLQGFPDDYLDITFRGKPAADGGKYKSLGNSWAVPCAFWIGQRIEAVEAIHAEQRKAA